MDNPKFTYKLLWIDQEDKRNVLITENDLEALTKYSEISNNNYKGVIFVRDIYEKIKEDM